MRRALMLIRLCLLELLVALTGCGDGAPPQVFVQYPGAQQEATEVDAGVVVPDAGPVDAGVPPEPYVRLLQPTGESLVKAHQEATSKADSGVPPLDMNPVDLTVGASVTIRWEAQGVEWVRIDVKGGTIQEGNVWRMLEGAEKLPAAQGEFTFTVPLEWGPWGAIAFRVEDAEAPAARNDASAQVTPYSNGHCPDGEVVINEVLLPDAEGHGGFVEVVNRHAGALDLNGFALRVVYDTLHQFPSGFTVPARGAAVLFLEVSRPVPVPSGVPSANISSPQKVARLITARSLNLEPVGCSSRGGASRSTSSWMNQQGGDAYFGPGVGSTKWPDAGGADSSGYGGDYAPSPGVAGLRSTPGYRANGSPFTARLETLPLSLEMPSAPPAFVVSGSPSGIAGLAVRASGGTPPYRFSLDPSVPVPAGLTLDRTSGQLAWRGPPAGATTAVTVRVDDSALFPVRVSKVITLETVPNPGGAVATIRTRSLLPVRLGWLCGVALAGSGGHLWSVLPGSLPLGLTLGEDGYLSGVPTTAGSYAFTVRLACPGPSVSCPTGTTTDERVLTLEVLPE